MSSEAASGNASASAFMTAASRRSRPGLADTFDAERIAAARHRVESDKGGKEGKDVKKLVPFLPESVFSWDNAGNNKWLISDKMPSSPAVRELFAHWEQGDLLDRLEASHRRLLDRRKNTVEYANPGELRARTASSCLVLQQVLLHRAERLLAAAGTMLLESNIYALALSVRGHYAATAVLGYVCNRLESLEDTNIEFPRFAHDIVCAFLGAKHPNHFAKAPDPPNIITCIEKADIYLKSHYSAYAKGCLRDTYDWLSEFAHASNFLSHSSAFTVDTVNNRFVFRHDGEIQERDFGIVVYLEISCGFFILLFDHLTRKLTDMGLTM